MNTSEHEKNTIYGGFWLRVVASLIDTLLMLAILVPVITLIYGKSAWLNAATMSGFSTFMFNYFFPAVAVILFWIYKSATPGKMALRLKIVDEKTGGKPSAGQLIGRYLAYYISIIPFLLGLIWVAFDRRKQGWHDKLAGTLVVKETDNINSKSASQF